MSDLVSKEAVSWEKTGAKQTMTILFNLLARRIDETLLDSTMKEQVLRDLGDLKINIEQVIERYGIKKN